nr:AAA family ATPase [Nocardia bovistercoris]
MVRLVAKDRDTEWRDLDVALTRQSAMSDPDGFVESVDLMVIDEIQRAPDLLLAIKAQVDVDPRPGRYLLTGSARVLGLRALPDTLVGRMETIELWPFSQGEIGGAPDGFIDAVFTTGTRYATAHSNAGPTMPNGSSAAGFRRRSREPTTSAGAVFSTPTSTT